MISTLTPTFFDKVEGEVFTNHSLAPYTSWRVGGPADYVVIPKDLADLSVLLKNLPADMPVLWLGLGSNTLIRDGGVKGLVIITQGALNLMQQENELTLQAQAGVACGQLARFSARQNLSGLEFLAGIPGTVGGALKMNAGCYGSETWQWVSQVQTIDRQGNLHMRLPSAFEVSYRHVDGLQNEWFVAGYFTLKPGDKAHSLLMIKELLAKRNMAQPTSWPNGGSVFKNPPGHYSAKLIEVCGLKGFKHGAASVSEKHANFIINEGGATAKDIEVLIADIAQRVLKETGVTLVPEVCMVGDEA